MIVLCLRIIVLITPSRGTCRLLSSLRTSTTAHSLRNAETFRPRGSRCAERKGGPWPEMWSAAVSKRTRGSASAIVRAGSASRLRCVGCPARRRAPGAPRRRMASQSVISHLLQTMSDGPSLPLAPPSFPLSKLTNTILFSCGSVRYLAVATCPISSLSLLVRRTIGVALSVSSSFSLASFSLSHHFSLPQLFSVLSLN
jgi:hypothetical protein